MANGTGRIESLGANGHAIHNAPAAENTEGIFQFLQPLFRVCITTIGQKAVSLKQTRRTDKPVRIPPE